jgi:GGDEF domain-containing protein
MQQPGFPKNEAARVAKLHSLNILDTPSDARFDRYTRITARIFDVPIALISLVDRYRQWFKSAEGLDAKETPRDISFCGHAILGDDVFEVQNAHRDPRFRDNPLVIGEPHIRFYAGIPLETPDGHKLGTLCVIDKVPRRLSDDEKKMLKHLADMVVGEMVSTVDTETGLANRNELRNAGSKCFETAPEGRRFSLLLFDVSDIVASPIDPDSKEWPGESFAILLRNHFPTAKTIAHMEGNHFCVLLDGDKSLGDKLAIERLCADAKNTLSANEGRDSVSIPVGRIQYDPKKHISIDDMIHEADEMFVRARSRSSEAP